MNSKVVIVSAARTAIGSFNGGLKDQAAPQLGAIVVTEALKRAGLAADTVDEVILGNVLQAGIGQNPARQAALAAGIPDHVPSHTVNKVCGSGLKAVTLAAQAILAGDAEVIVAGGMENMTRAPYLLPQARNGYRLGHGELIDTLVHDGLTCAMNRYHMGITAENLAARYDISRAAQDDFSAASQQKAAAAQTAGHFSQEIVAVPIPQRKGDPVPFEKDEYIKAETTPEGLAKLRPAFKKDGSVTAGNASGINDGAAAVVVMSAERARLNECAPLAVIRSYASAGVDPSVMGLGPVPAIRRALEKGGLELSQIEAIELNEAFAAQSLAVLKELGLENDSRVNPLGGAVALGHPIGASGARILVTLLHHMERNNLRLGLAALCIGGGQGIALVVERT
ncbi:MAG: acetyl-CoA C-acetyltransferase [Blastocatellia bacterium]|nr:acetyl-CoA C-acetyltransferase [Blastocatellia bacterium]